MPGRSVYVERFERAVHTTPDTSTPIERKMATKTYYKPVSIPAVGSCLVLPKFRIA